MYYIINTLYAAAACIVNRLDCVLCVRRRGKK